MRHARVSAGEVKTWRKAVFSEHDNSEDMYREVREGGGRRVIVRTKEWKLIFFMDERLKNKDGALYDLIRDPWEKTNLYNVPTHQSVVKDLEAMARAWSEGG